MTAAYNDVEDDKNESSSNGGTSSSSSPTSSSFRQQSGRPQQQEQDDSKKKWSKLSLKSSNSICEPSALADNDDDFLLVSNPQVPLSSTIGIRNWASFVSTQDERDEILQEIRLHVQDDFAWEGFDHRRRVKRYHLSSSSCIVIADDDIDTTETATNSNSTAEYSSSSSSSDDDSSPPAIFVHWAKRLYQETGHVATHVSVEEYAAPKWSHSGQYAPHQTVTNFESSSTSTTLHTTTSTDCPYFVAQIPLNKAAIQHLNKPSKRRQANCWNLASDDHYTDVYMPPGSMLIKTDESLWDWRFRIMADSTVNNDCSNTPDKNVNSKKKGGVPVLILKFYNLPLIPPSNGDPKPGANDATDVEDEPYDEKDGFGYVASSQKAREEAAFRMQAPMPPLHELLTIIITTSPVRSNPSTELLQRTMETFKHGGNPDFCYKCRKVIVCDGFRTKHEGQQQNDNEDSSQSKQQQQPAVRSYRNDKQAMRNGIVTPDQAERYRQFKVALQKLCDEAEAEKELSSSSRSVFENTSLVELEERQGYGFALRHALRHSVSTPFVCVIQHDRTFMRPTPVHEVVHTMWKRPYIKYVGFSMRSNLMYRDIFLTKYGRAPGDPFYQMILRPPELRLDASMYGPDSKPLDKMSASISDDSKMSRTSISDKVRRKLDAMAASYHAGSHQAIGQREWLMEQERRKNNSMRNDDGDDETRALSQLSLTPTLFWYDNVHICETAHYRDFIFHPSYKMVARGGFVEDKLSPVITRTVERLGLQEGHARFGCYLLDDHSGTFFTGHYDGGSFLTLTTTGAKEEETIRTHPSSSASSSATSGKQR